MRTKKHHKEKNMENKTINQFFCFQVGETEYAFPIESINEILSNFKLTSVPQTGDEVEGVINWRGDIIPVINLGVVLNKSSDTETDTKKPFVIIVEVENETIGFLTQKIKNIREVETNQILDPPHLIKGKKDLLKGVIKVGEDQIIHLLNERKLLYFKEEIVQGQEFKNKSIKKEKVLEKEIRSSEEELSGHLVFQLEDQLYAFSIDDLEKISSTSLVDQNWTNEETLLKGTTRLNDDIVPLVDFKKFLGIQKRKGEKNILFLKRNQKPLALPIDKLKEISYFKNEDFLPPKAKSSSHSKRMSTKLQILKKVKKINIYSFLIKNPFLKIFIQELIVEP